LAEQTGANARCPRCGAAFHCGAREASCNCAQVALGADTLTRLRADYGAQCLCGACLRTLAAAALPPLQIRLDDLRGAEIQALLDEHLSHMRSISPPESVHALDLDALRRPGITFWTAWSPDGRLLGCGALKELDACHGEIKSMRTAAAQRRSGVARAMLAHIVAEAESRGYARLSLETGAEPAFAPARGLYERFGFTFCAPFEGYVEDPNSVFMTRTLPRR
jgi:putative acetyltransferase